MFCSNCGNKLTEGAKFCSICGSKVESGNESDRMDVHRTDSRDSAPAYYYNPMQQKQHRNKKVIIGISAVAVLCLVIIIMVSVISKKSEKPQYLISKTSSETQQKEINDKSYEETETQQNINMQREEPQPDVDPGPQNYTSTTNPQLSTMTDTALVQINGEQYVVDDNGMFLSSANCVEQINIQNIAGEYTIIAQIPGLYDRLRTGFTTSQFDDVNCFLQLENFYDSSELDIYGSPNYWAGTLASEGMDASYYKTTDMTVEQYDTSGITAFYFHIVTEGPTTGKVYDIEVLAVSDFSDDEPAPESDLCAGCAGTGNCFACSGSGKKNFYNAVTHTMEQKDCTVCAGTGKCSICHGSGQK